MSLTARSAPGLVAIAFALLLAIAPAPAVAASSCPPQNLTQPFSSWGDNNWYTLVPGQSPDNFDGIGWTFGGGARLTTATVYGGATATVLVLPSGGWAVSPEMCVDSTYQGARMMIRGVYGSSYLRSSVSYEHPWGWSQPDDMGAEYGSSTWHPSGVLTLNPGASSWQMARFTLSGGGYNAGSLIYDFYVDPYGRG